MPAVPSRNRRIGEFLKELRFAEAKGTGLRKIFSAMAQNGSPPPRFEFDEQRTYFSAILEAHPASV
jgi:ATP-dependent DNA helicase RecG